jgi:hypothetical protein
VGGLTKRRRSFTLHVLCLVTAQKNSTLFSNLVTNRRTPDGLEMIPGLFSWANVGADTLRAANERPEDFPGLAVRVAGFSAYWSSLSPAFRQMVVDRIVG